MTIDWANISTEESHTDPKIIVNGDGTPSLDYLKQLRIQSNASVQNIAQQLSDEFGLVSEIGNKSDAATLDKSVRPSTLTKYRWFTLAHIRDFLRFRTHLHRASDFDDVLSLFARLQDKGRISIIKIDPEKLIRPGLFGWRMVAVDLRIQPSGLIVEHYMTFREMIEINEKWLHKVYENWRSVNTDDLTTAEQYHLYRDARFSNHAYRELLFDGVLRDERDPLRLDPLRRSTQETIVGALASSLNLNSEL